MNDNLICPNCGLEVTGDVERCPSCGEKLICSETNGTMLKKVKTPIEISVYPAVVEKEPLKLIKYSYQVLLLLAALNILFAFTVPKIMALSKVYLTINILVLLVLAYFIKRRSLVAIVTSIVLYGFDSIVALVNALQQSKVSYTIVFRVVVLIILARGFIAIKSLPNENGLSGNS